MSFGMPYGVKERDKNGKLRSVNTINGERYVYYERLQSDYYQGVHTGFVPPELGLQVYNKANSVLNWRIEYGGSPENIGAYFAKLAALEFRKEKALLETHFKTSYDPTSIECGQALIEAYNTILSTREIFERNALLLANTNQTTLIVNFPYYLDEALEEWINEPGRDFAKEVDDLAISGEVEGKDKSEKIAAAIQKTLNDNIYTITDIALQKMFGAGAENGLKKKLSEEEFNTLGKAYKEVLDALKKLQNDARKNEFIRGMTENYGLNKLGEDITNKFTKGKNGKKLNKGNIMKAMSGFKFETQVKNKRGILGGGASEIFGNFLAQVVKGTSNVKIDGIHTGKMGLQAEQKADMVFMIGFDDGAAEAAQEKLNSFEGTGRGSNVADVKKFTEEMFADFGNNSGFMLFVNSKNYTPNWHFRNGYYDKKGNKIGASGYSAGSSINLNTWDDMMHAMNVRGRDLIFTIMQLIPGAIGSKRNDKERVSDMFARAIGSALFDDFVPDDPYDKKTNQRTVHLLWLNGIYIPLSVFYTLLSEAFYDFKDSLDRNELVSVEFNLPSGIMFPEQKDQIGVENPWVKQSEKALDEITISYHFLSGFQKFMKRFYDLS